MPVLPRPLQERFAAGVASGMSQAEAYKRAGFKTSSTRNVAANASKLVKVPHVKARIAELQVKQAQRLGVTVPTLVEELDAMLSLAMASNQPAAGVAAIMSKAKLLGLVVDKVEAEVRRPMREPGDGSTMTMDEWQEKFAPKRVQ